MRIVVRRGRLELGERRTRVGILLKVHPQTVRYRVNQLDELFGDRMHDAGERFTLELALRAHYLLDRG